MKKVTQTRIPKLNRERLALEKKLSQSIKHEAMSRSMWVRGHRRYQANVKKYMGLVRVNTKKAARLRTLLDSWEEESRRLTQTRDAARELRSFLENQLAAVDTSIALARLEVDHAVTQENEIVKQVFSLNEQVVEASRCREECLSRHVFPRLVGVDGKLRSQVSFTSSDGLRRVVAMVNSMTIIDRDSAEQARGLIDKFFERFSNLPTDSKFQIVYKICQGVLLEKVSFKVGPDLYRFLSVSIDAKDLPELYEAQTLLKNSIRSEKTSSYFRIYERTSRTDKWMPVRQS